MKRKIAYALCFWLVTFLAVFLGAIMTDGAYTQFPSINSVVPNGSPQPVSDQVQPKDMVGTGTWAANSGFNLGGPSGITLQGGQGMWAGGQYLGSAPFSVDLSGNLKANKVTIQDKNGTAVIDSAGVVSSTQFSSSSVSASVNPSTMITSTEFSYVVPGMTLSFSPARSINIYFFSTLNINSSVTPGSATPYSGYAQMALDGSRFGPQVTSGFLYSGGYFNVNNYTTVGFVQTVAAGSHTLTIRAATSNSLVGAYGYGTWTLGFLVLGK